MMLRGELIMTIGEKIKTLRLEKGLTQEELSKLANVPVVTLQQYERNLRKEPKDEQLEKIAYALDTSAAYLRGYIDSPTIDLEKIAQIAEELRQENERLREETRKAIQQQVARKLDQGIRDLSIPDYDLQSILEDVEEELLYTVHKICGMNITTIPEDVLDGTLWDKWNPRKIVLIKEFLEDSEPVLQKLFATIGRVDKNSEDQNTNEQS